MYSCMFFEVRNLISHLLLAANRYLFLMLSWVKAGELSNPCYQYTQRILGKVLISCPILMQKRRRTEIALRQPHMMADIIDCIELQLVMLDEGAEIRKVIISNFKQQLPLFEEMSKKLQRLPQLAPEDHDLVSEYSSVETSLSKWRTLSNENYQLIKKYANYEDAVRNIDTYEKLEIAISTQQLIEESLEKMAKSKWPAQIYNDFAEWTALQKYNILPLLGP